MLNPRDSFRITITAKGSDAIATPIISARTFGVTAKPRQASHYSIFTGLVSVILGLAIAAAYPIYSHFSHAETADEKSEQIVERLSSVQTNIEQTVDSIQKLKNETKSSMEATAKKIEVMQKISEETQRQFEMGKPETPQIVFSAFNNAGLSQLHPQFLRSGETSYINAGFFLFHSFLADQDKGEKYLAAINSLISQTNIAPSSYGCLEYLAAKMENRRGRLDKAAAHLAQCKEKTPLMYEFLMAQDQKFDVKVLESELSRKAGE